MDYISLHLDRDDLNDKIGGGLPKGSLMIVEGESGMGKSILCQRIAYGALVNGYTVTYISTEMTTLDFVRQMASLNYNIETYLLEKKLTFITLLPVFGKIKRENNLIFELKRAPHLFKSDILIIDSLSYPLITKLSEEEVLDLITFFNRIKFKDKVIILTFDPNNVDNNLKRELERTADIYFYLGIKMIAGQLTRYIEIKRFRNPKSYFEQFIPFRVEPRLGFVIEIITVV